MSQNTLSTVLKHCAILYSILKQNDFFVCRVMSKLVFLLGVGVGLLALLAQLDGGEPKDWRSEEMAVFHLPQNE